MEVVKTPTVKEQLQELLTPLFTVMTIQEVNHDPHPYVIGSGHVVWASDHNGGMLTEDAIRRAEKDGVRCAMNHCHVAYDGHKSTKVVFLQLTRNMTDAEATECWRTASKLMAEKGIEGVSFVDTPEKFRIN